MDIALTVLVTGAVVIAGLLGIACYVFRADALAYRKHAQHQEEQAWQWRRRAERTVRVVTRWKERAEAAEQRLAEVEQERAGGFWTRMREVDR